MSMDLLTAALVKRVMRWEVRPDRFLTDNRGWIARGRFRPTERMQDAFKLLVAAKPTDYSLGGGNGKRSWAKVQIGGVFGEASDQSLPTAICLATARALGIEVEACRG
jgi:hypothetical protein